MKNPVFIGALNSEPLTAPFMDVEIDRLRKVIKRVEMSGCIPRNEDSCCPWCKALVEGEGMHNPESSKFVVRHEPDCMAFYPNGAVR